MTSTRCLLFTLSAALLLAAGSLSPLSAQSPQGAASDHAGEIIAGDTVLELLTAYHQLPSKRAFLKVDPNAERELERIARSDALLTAHRYNALAALAAYWPKESEALFGELIASPPEEIMLHQLIVLSGRHFAAARAVELIAPLLSHEDEQIRYTAVGALGAIDHSLSRKALKARRDEEPSEWVLSHLDRMLIDVR